MKTKFLQACIGITIVLLATTFFIRTIDGAQAAPGPDKFFQQGTSKIGKYSMAFVMNSENWKAVIVMDTETGKTKIYNEGTAGFALNDRQLPVSPM